MMRSQFGESEFWGNLNKRLADKAAEYLLGTGYELFVGTFGPPVLLAKSYESFEEKVYRRNVVDNGNWPEAPSSGWYTPENCYERVKDIVRTMYTVKYLDGVGMVVNEIAAACREAGLEHEISYEAREEGYYAAHAVIKFTFEVPGATWRTYRFLGHVEIQITTQLQEVIRLLTHRYYEKRRVSTEASEPNQKWQWDYQSEEFAANYLGHILHYLEGMILEVRDRRGKGNG